jgi:quinol monooxygenase YgiN
MTHSAVDPSEVDEVRRLFNEDVRPVFEVTAGCLGIDLIVNVEPNAGGLVDGCSLTRWASLGEMQAALESRSVLESQVRLRALLRQEPVSKTYEILE